MTTRERTVIYSLLAVLSIISALQFLTWGGSQALASPVIGADDLGPAEALILSGDDGEVTLRNSDGRLTWSDDEFSRAYSVAFVHVGRVVAPLMDADDFVEERETLEEQIVERDQELQSRMQGFYEKNKDIGEGDPDYEEAQREYFELMNIGERWEREKMGRRGRLASDQIERAFRDVVAAVDVVAEERGIDLVYRFIPVDDEFRALVPEAAYLSIRARTVLKYPEGLDITRDVMEELALEAE